MIRSRYLILAMAAASLPAAIAAQPVAHVAEVEYQGGPQPETAPGAFRNPVLPGFQPDPSLVKVGKDFYLVNSTFAWFPGIPVYHSRDLVNWRQIGNAIDRPGMFSFKGMRTNDAIFAPAISHYGGKFRILDTCVRCGGNFMLVADRPEGPWSDPVWLDFEGIDPSLFVDDDGSAWVLNNGAPEGEPRYEGHRAIWIQRIELATGKMFGPRKVLIDGGVRPEDKPIWAEGPHIFKHDGWYYLTAAEGGTAEDHSQTIYRSRRPDGPYEAGPVNPILTQRDLPPDRPSRVEATGHADFVQLDDGSWWAVFLATVPFAGQSTLLGRETFLLPVTWKDGWPSILPKGAPVPLTVKRPPLPSDERVDWTHWRDTFNVPKLAPQWLHLRDPATASWYRIGNGLDLTARPVAPGSLNGQPAFLGRRLRQQTARITARIAFTPERDEDFAGLMAFMNEDHFTSIGITRIDGKQRIALRERRRADQSQSGVTVASAPLSGSGPVELAIEIDRGTADFAWRPAGQKDWQYLARGQDVEHMASVHGGLFTGTVIGPFAQQATALQ
ncbi:glycoside hydrolase family 43 protein [Novosphingobium mathurense]|uniref:Alpha-N-arabinofuranosidase n=1 Tax=Novosphingobium mathurense TaxID=428990 RepID=A0A1U6I631_9SPHN|nr:glycoside hydrolase family 43 protein [Novosphingobium mathurense]SLK03480.1 alpha-N-arabinofuranosidase [Novosphingobium mathurense]